MRYALLIGHDEAAQISGEERSRRHAALSSFAEQMQATGMLACGERLLQPADTAVTVRCWDGGDVIVADGPLTPSREQIAGFFVVDCQDLDEAVTVAAKVPAAWYGAVEVRPVRET
jgi:hypothetical protein